MSDGKNPPTEKASSGALQTTNNGLSAGALIDQSLSRLTQEQAQNLMQKAGEEALKLEVKARTQNLDYVVGKKAIEDHIETFDMLDKRGRTTRQSVVSDVKTGAGNMRIESKAGATCFVASVAYQDPNHPDVIFLRQFRDSKLASRPAGRAFIQWYWLNGPRIAKIVDRHGQLRAASKAAISAIVWFLKRCWR